MVSRIVLSDTKTSRRFQNFITWQTMAATLLNTRFLCSDFNIRNLIGVSEDLEDHILVTCRGVVKQYNVHDQKQTQSWTTKTWHPFTSAAVCDPVTNKVVVVINNSSISQWNHDDDINKFKRENFETSIYRLIVSGGQVYVVFTTGHIEELSSALKTRKQPKQGCLKENDSIIFADVNSEGDFAVLLVKDEENTLKIWKRCISKGTNSLSYNLITKNANLTGICVVSSKLFTLWSNGSFHCLNLDSDPLEKLPGRHYSTVSAVDVSKNVKIIPVSSSHIAIVGADTKNEGSVLLLWDVKFAMVTSSRRLKMYQDPPMGWASSKGIIVVDGGSLMRTPYIIAESTLATVFGSRISNDVEFEPEICYGWDATCDFKKGEIDTVFVNKSQKLVEVLRNTNQISLSESMIVESVIPQLIEKQELLLLHEAIEVFEDIPESCLFNVLKFYLQCDNSQFDGLLKYPSMATEYKIEDEDEVVKCPFSPGKAFFINAVLAKPHTDVQLIKELHKLSFEDSLVLIQYLYFLILTGEAVLCPDESGELSLGEVSEWLSFLLDTKYHQLVMTSQVTIHRLLLSCFTQLTKLRGFLEDTIKLEPLIKRVVEEDGVLQQDDKSCSVYSLERLVILR